MDEELEPVIHEETEPVSPETAASTEVADESHGGYETAFYLDTYGWVSIAMIAVIGIMIWRRVPGAIANAMDKRIAEIRGEIDEAAKLRSEAEALKAEYEAKTANADNEAAALLERARDEADNIVAQAESDADALIERRSRLAEEKIAAAECSAIAEVRSKAASAATAAAAALIEEKHDAEADKSLVDGTISTMDARLN